MDSASQGLLVLFIILLFCSAYCSCSESAFSVANKIRLKTKADEGNKRAKKAMYILTHFDDALTTLLICNNIVNITLSSIATVLFIELLGGDIGATVSTAVITVVVLIFGEITPKSIAKESPEAFARFSAPIINFIAVILTPVNYLFSLWKKLVSLVVKSS